MSYQLALCSRVVRTGDITPALNFGITVDDFTMPEARNFWTLILSYYLQQQTRGSVITEGMLHGWFDRYGLQDDMAGITTHSLCYEVRKQRIIVEGNSAVVKFSQEVQNGMCDPAVSLADLHGTVSSLIALGTTANTDVPMKVGLDNVMRKIELAKQGVKTAIMEWPWEPHNRVTFGVQPDDYIVFYGRPKSMKTWVLCKLIAYAFETQKKVLVYTKEMTPDNLYMRTLACILGLYYDDLREASAAEGKPLKEDDEKALLNLVQYIADIPEMGTNLVVLSGRDVAPGGDTVPWLNSKIEQYKPDILFVDGIYLLSDQKKSTSDHTRVMNISRDLRAMNLGTRVPIIATMQANRKAAGHNDANLDEIAYSDALAQDATIAARVINDKASPTISVVIGGSREFKLHGFRINGVPARDFSFHSELTEKDIMDAREADQSEAEEKARKEKKAKKDKKDKTETVRTPSASTARAEVDATVDADMNKQFKSLNGAL